MGSKEEGSRVTILHRNIPNMLGQFTSLLAKENMNITLMTNKSKKAYAYTMIDVDAEISGNVVKRLEDIEGVLKVRVIV